MAIDIFKNFAKVTVSTGYDDTATTVVLSGSEGEKLPAVPFNAVWYNSTDYADPTDDPNRELIRVTNIATDTLTVTRAQESTTAATHNTGGKTYKIIAGLTAKTLNSAFALAAPAPDSATSAGDAGQFAYDARNIYICIATNTWRRTAVSTWVNSLLTEDDFYLLMENNDHFALE